MWLTRLIERRWFKLFWRKLCKCVASLRLLESNLLPTRRANGESKPSTLRFILKPKMSNDNADDDERIQIMFCHGRGFWATWKAHLIWASDMAISCVLLGAYYMRWLVRFCQVVSFEFFVRISAIKCGWGKLERIGWVRYADRYGLLGWIG